MKKGDPKGSEEEGSFNCLCVCVCERERLERERQIDR